MKKAIEYRPQWSRMLLLGLLLTCMIPEAYSQFQHTIGAPFPITERGPGGIITPSGDYVVLGSNFDLLNVNGDWQLDWLDNSGNFISPSKLLSLSANGFESASWIEKDVICGSNNSYVIAGDDDQGNMLVARTNLSGTPFWTRSIGSPNEIESSVWAEMDPNGLILVVGNQYDPSTGKSFVAIAQLDCNGNDNWKNTFGSGNYSLTATSATSFPTAPGGFGVCYITGKATPVLGGNDQLFIMRINTGGGTPFSLQIYDIAPNADDAGTCIQGSFQFNPQGELWVSGYSIDNNANKTALLMKTDLNGIPIWAKNYDVQGGDEFVNHFEFAANGKLVLTGKVLESTVFQGTKGGQCMLMRLDASTGSTIDWIHGFIQNDFTAQGNRVEVTANDEYFITGQSNEVLTPSIQAGNILAIKTDAQGYAPMGCYYDTVAQVIPQMPVVVNLPLPALVFGQMTDNLPKTMSVANFDNQKKSCGAPPPPCDCDFTWNTGNCSNVTFNANCINPFPGNYTFSWDIFCDNNPELTVVVGAPNNAFTYTFPCGGGTYIVCLKITDPAGTICTIQHTVVVPNTCCGSVSGNLVCHPTDPYKYNFTINATVPTGLTGCNYVLTSPYTLSNVVYNGNTITGCIAIPDPIPTAASFTLQSNCTCITTGLPTTCTQSFFLATVCCKEIHVDDQVVCEGLDVYDVPVYASNWPPVNGTYLVTWYVMPKPASGICPSTPWGGTPYQSTVVSGSLEPLHLFPNTLPGDLCVYAVINLNDGPCTQITSNIAMVQLCKPNSCTLNNQDWCYTGSCVTPGLITLTSTAASPTCFALVEWFDPAGNSVQIGGSTYQPPCLSMANDQNCYEDFVYTAVITDGCGQHQCQSTIRLYSGNAPIGTLTLVAPDVSPVCWAEDVTLTFTPNCAGDPALWAWYERDCIGNVTILPNAGLMNNSFNVNELHNGTWYGVGAVNGVCPIKTVETLVEVIAPAVIFGFSAVPDPCAEVQVVLSASVTPGLISCSNAPYPCTYTYEWYKDGFLIGTTPNGSASESFTYVNPFPGPPPETVAGNYYAIIKEDCCPRNVLSTWVESIRQACEPVVMGPCFICDFQPETFMVQMVLPPNIPCPDACTFEWFTAVLDGSGNCVPGISLGTGPSVTISTPGQYFVQSDCNGCIKLVKFDVLGCTSQASFGQSTCGVISVEDLMPKAESPLSIFPNPTTGEITIEWSGNAPKNARIFITDPMGRRLRTLTVPDAGNSLTTAINDLPSGLYFVKVQSADRLFTVAKLVKE